MGKKAAHSGESPKDRSINMMDKFITRNDRIRKHKNSYQLGANHQMYHLIYGH